MVLIQNQAFGMRRKDKELGYFFSSNQPLYGTEKNILLIRKVCYLVLRFYLCTIYLYKSFIFKNNRG